MTNANDTSTVVTRILEQVVAGNGIDAGLFADDATFDATVPHWRFGLEGADRIATELSGWYAFTEPARYDELRRLPIPGGELVHLAVDWTEDGVAHAVHQSWTIELTGDGGRIATLSLWCGGRWPAPLLAEMEAANAAASG